MPTDRPASDVLRLSAQIVSAHVGANRVDADALPGLIDSVYRALSQTGGQAGPATSVELTPAVSVRKSITPAAMICLDCGKKFQMLKRHLRTDHDLTPDAYRQKWSLPSTYPMTAPDYTNKRSDLAKSIGLGTRRQDGTSSAADSVTTAAAATPAPSEPRPRGKPSKAPAAPAKRATAEG